MSTKAKARKVKKSKPAASIVWFEIPADNPERAKKFYGALFGWKINPFPGMTDYWHIDTGGGDETPDGGMLTRKHPAHAITNYVNVPSVDKAAAKVQKLGGSICMPKTAVPKMGYFVICQDTENNTFALWEMNPNASKGHKAWNVSPRAINSEVGFQIGQRSWPGERICNPQRVACRHSHGLSQRSASPTCGGLQIRAPVTGAARPPPAECHLLWSSG